MCHQCSYSSWIVWIQSFETLLIFTSQHSVTSRKTGKLCIELVLGLCTKICQHPILLNHTVINSQQHTQKEHQPTGPMRQLHSTHVQPRRCQSCTTTYINHLTPNDHFSGRTAPLTSRCCIILFIQQRYVLNILNMLHTLCFFLFKMPFIS